MIEIRNLSFSYGSRQVLNKVNLSAKSGEITMLLGRNGAGKTTLFRCILGLAKGYYGSIKISGREAKSLSAKEIAHNVAYIPQVHYPSFNYSVLDMVVMGTGSQVFAFSSPKKQQYDAAYRALDSIGITHLANQDYCEISGGEQQMTLIARALVQGAPILIMDEPTSSLDYGNQIKVMAKARQLSEQGYTVIMSAHNPQYALSYAHNAAALQDGAVLAHGVPSKILDKALIKELYGVDSYIETFNNTPFIIPITGIEKGRKI